MPIEITGADIEEIDRDVADNLIESMEEEQKYWYEHGADALPGSKRNTATRFQFYEQQTLPQEKLMVLDPDYREKAAAWAEYQARAARLAEQQSGFMPRLQRAIGISSATLGPPPPEYPPLIPAVWYIILEGKPVAGPFADQQTAVMAAGGMGVLTPEMVPQPDGMGGLVPPSQPAPIAQRPSFWFELFQFGQFPSGWSLMGAHAGDYLNLYNQLGRRLEAMA